MEHKRIMTEIRYAAKRNNTIVRLSTNINRIRVFADEYLVIDNCKTRRDTFFNVIFRSSNYDEILKYKDVKGL